MARGRAGHLQELPGPTPAEGAAHALERFILDLSHAFPRATQFAADFVQSHDPLPFQAEPPYDHGACGGCGWGGNWGRYATKVGRDVPGAPLDVHGGSGGPALPDKAGA